MDRETIHRRSLETSGPHSGRLLQWIAAITSAALIAITAAAQDSAPPTAQIQPSPANLSVHGVVRNAVSGEPIPRALVRIEGDAATGALTDSEGKFEISGLPPGPQLFEVLKPGYLDHRKAGGATLVIDDEAVDGHNVIIAPDMPALEFTLAPACAIHGQITLSTGDPAKGIQVELLRRMVLDGRGVWQTAINMKTLSDGSYRFGGLPDGQYVVYTHPTLDSEPASSLVAPGRGASVRHEGYASQFFPDARDIAGAAKIRLADGEQAQANLNLTLEPFHAVTATATYPDARSGGPQSSADHSGMNVSATVLDAQGHQLPYGAQYDPSTQTVQALLPDGAYSLMLTTNQVRRFNFVRGQNGLETMSQSSAADVKSTALVGQVEFTVAGRAISNLRVPLASQHASSVRLTVLHSASAAAQGPPNQNAGTFVTATQAGGWIGDGVSSNFADGIETGPMNVNYLPPGPYWMHVHSARTGLCEGSFTAGGVHLAREPLLLGVSGATAPLELTVRDDCAKLTLSLPAALALPTAGEERFSTVYVIPDFDSSAEVEAITLRPTTNTSFTLEALTPGDYHVYTFANPVALDYRNRETLAALADSGKAITLSPGVTSSLVLEAPAK